MGPQNITFALVTYELNKGCFGGGRHPYTPLPWAVDRPTCFPLDLKLGPQLRGYEQRFKCRRLLWQRSDTRNIPERVPSSFFMVPYHNPQNDVRPAQYLYRSPIPTCWVKVGSSRQLTSLPVQSIHSIHSIGIWKRKGTVLDYWSISKGVFRTRRERDCRTNMKVDTICLMRVRAKMRARAIYGNSQCIIEPMHCNGIQIVCCCCYCCC